MKSDLRRLTVAGLLLLACAATLSAQIAKMTPVRPKWGESVAVAYDPSAPGARFLPGDEIYALSIFKTPAGYEKGWTRLERKDGRHQADIRIPEGVGFLTIYFITMDGWDDKADLGVMIYRRDGVAAEGAWHGKMLADFDEALYQAAFQNERRLYPGNYAIYRDKWFLEGAFKKAEFKAIVGRDMKELEKKRRQDSPALLWAMSTGRLHLDDEKASREILRRLARQYPEAEETASAFHDYEYQEFAKQLKGEGPEEVKKLQLDLLREHPGLKGMRQTLQRWAWDASVPLDLVLAVGEAWMKDEPENPMPMYLTAGALLRKEGDLKQASAYIGRSLEMLLAGRLRFYGDVSGSLTQFWLPDNYQLAAEIHEKLGDRASALAEIKAAQTLGQEVRAETFAREGAVWRDLGFNKKAEDAFLEARRRGAKKAESELKDLYRRRRASDEGFEAWLSAAEQKATVASGSGKKPAPAFDLKTLDGESLRLADLGGKVVVLNFWYIGCAPCRVEMPGLNKLVEEFASGDVVFIGLALDKADPLRDFLKKNPFKYRIVPEASATASAFGVSVYPTHILINRRGEIEFFMTGGSPDRHEELRPIIQGLLK